MPRSLVQPREQRRDLELVAEVQRGGRLVEQHHVGGLRQRARDDDALLLAAAQRGERAALEGKRARRRQRLARDGDVRGPSSANGPEVRIAAHQRDFEHRVVEGETGFLRHDRDPPRDLGARHAGEVDAVERTRPLAGPSMPASSRSSVVLPEPFGPRIPDQAAGPHVDRHAAQPASAPGVSAVGRFPLRPIA